MELQAKTCQKVGWKSSCKCDKYRVQKADKWLHKKQPCSSPMCYQFRQAHMVDDQPTLQQLQEIFGYARCICCGYTLLHLAVTVGSKDLVEYYLSRKHEVGVRSDNGETALHLACAIDDSWFAEQLLIAKADVNDIDDLGCTPLQICLSHDMPSVAIVKVLLDHGAKPNKLFSLDENIEELMTKMVKANTRTSSGLLPLYEAVYKGDHEAAQRLLKDGACPNSLNCYGRTLLQVACYKNSVACAEALVNAGANVNEPDLDGRTALHYAIISESTEIVRLLLASNCDMWVRDSDGYTALGMAALTNRLQVADQLLDHGARCTEVLLMEALERQCTEVALSILRRRFFRVDDNKLGRTLLYCAITTGQQEVVSYLQSLGIEVGYEGSDDEEDNLPVVPCDVTKTTKSPRFLSSILVACRSMESSARKVQHPRHSSSVPETTLPARFVSSEVVAGRLNDYATRKTVKHNATETTRRRTYVPSPQDIASNNAPHRKRTRYARLADDCQEFKLRTYQRASTARSKPRDTFGRNDRHGYEKQPSRKCIVSNDRPVILADKEVSSKHGKTTIHSNSAQISSPITDPTAKPNMKVFLASASRISSKPTITQNIDSLFHIYCQKKMKSKLTTYKGVCFKSFSKEQKIDSVSSNVDTFFQFYKYCVQYD